MELSVFRYLQFCGFGYRQLYFEHEICLSTQGGHIENQRVCGVCVLKRDRIGAQFPNTVCFSGCNLLELELDSRVDFD